MLEVCPTSSGEVHYGKSQSGGHMTLLKSADCAMGDLWHLLIDKQSLGVVCSLVCFGELCSLTHVRSVALVDWRVLFSACVHSCTCKISTGEFITLASFSRGLLCVSFTRLWWTPLELLYFLNTFVGLFKYILISLWGFSDLYPISLGSSLKRLLSFIYIH